MALYAIHPRSGGMTATQLAVAYGLTNPADYIVVSDNQPGFLWHEYINLYERDANDKTGYRDIKYEHGDERDGTTRYTGGYLWKEVDTSVRRKRLTGEDL